MQDTHTGNRPLYGNIPGLGDQLVSRYSLRPTTGRAPQSDDSYLQRSLFFVRSSLTPYLLMSDTISVFNFHCDRSCIGPMVPRFSRPLEVADPITLGGTK